MQNSCRVTGILMCAIGLVGMGSSVTGNAADLLEADIPTLLRAQAQGDLSCEQLARSTLDRIKRLDPKLKAFITINPRMLEDAHALDERRRVGDVRPLHCVPIAFKDNIDVRGMPTTGGSVLFRNNMPRADSEIARRLRAAGALLVGKANLDEFAVSGSTISSLGGQTLNPYDVRRFAAGSSGGPAVAVATGMAACAIGSETVNSLRNAASSAGVVAVRTSHGAISRRGVIPQSSTMDVVGPICRSVADTIQILNIIEGRDQLDPATTAFEGLAAPIATALQPIVLKGVRVGILENLFGTGPEHQAVNEVVHTALTKLRALGLETVNIDDVSFDSERSSKNLNVANYEFRPLFEAYLAQIKPVPGVATLQEYYNAKKFPSTMQSFLKNAVSWKAPLQMDGYRQSLKKGEALRKRILGLMDDYKLDALVYPSQKRPPLRIDEARRPERNGVFASAIGFPAIDLPAGFTPRELKSPQGLPIGLDILGKPGQDARLLGIAMSIEQVLDARRPPPLSKDDN